MAWWRSHWKHWTNHFGPQTSGFRSTADKLHGEEHDVLPIVLLCRDVYKVPLAEAHVTSYASQCQAILCNMPGGSRC
jgi:hypothetical protein